MEDSNYFLEIAFLALAIAGPILGAVYAWFRTVKKCVDKNNKRTFRQSQATIIMAKRLDYIFEQEHGKNLNLANEVEQLLRDAEGNL